MSEYQAELLGNGYVRIRDTLSGLVGLWDWRAREWHGMALPGCSGAVARSESARALRWADGN